MTTIDQLIRESKQLTTDLMALRHELRRSESRGTIFCAARDRMDLIYDNARRIADEIFALRYPPQPKIVRQREMVREIESGQLRLTAGGRQ